MKNKYIKSLVIILSIFAAYSILYFGISFFKKQEVAGKEENILLKNFMCSKGTILHVFDNNIPICLNEESLTATLSTKSIKIAEIKDDISAIASFNKHLIIAVNDDLILYTFTEDSFKKSSEYKMNQGNITAIIQDPKDNNIFYVSTEVMVESPEENKSFLFTIRIEELNNTISFSTISETAFIDDLKVVDVIYLQKIYLLLNETHPFLENKNIIIDSLAQNPISLPCSEQLSYIKSFSTDSFLFYAYEKCDTIEPGYHTWNNTFQKVTIPDIKIHDPLYYSPDTVIVIKDGKIRTVKLETGEEIEHFALPNEFNSEVHILNKGSIIALKNVYLYVDIQYTENIIYRVYFRKS
jgi:hypothetical protein